jgi:hypothetical protein
MSRVYRFGYPTSPGKERLELWDNKRATKRIYMIHNDLYKVEDAVSLPFPTGDADNCFETIPLRRKDIFQSYLQVYSLVCSILIVQGRNLNA